MLRNEFQTPNKVHPIAWLVAILVGILLGVISQDPLLVFISVLFLPIIFYFSFRDNEPQVIFIAFIFYYLSITIKLFYAIYFNTSFTLYSESTLIESTTYISFVAMFFFMLGVYISTKKIKFKKKI